MAQVQTRKGKSCVCWGEISGLTCALSQLTGLNDFSRVHVNGSAGVLFNLISECVGVLIVYLQTESVECLEECLWSPGLEISRRRIYTEC